MFHHRPPIFLTPPCISSNLQNKVAISSPDNGWLLLLVLFYYIHSMLYICTSSYIHIYIYTINSWLMYWPDYLSIHIHKLKRMMSSILVIRQTDVSRKFYCFSNSHNLLSQISQNKVVKQMMIKVKVGETHPEIMIIKIQNFINQWNVVNRGHTLSKTHNMVFQGS